MMGEHIEDWTSLIGQVVGIRRGGSLVRLGQVETVTLTGDALWLRSEGVEPRALYLKADGYTAWTVPNPSVKDAPLDHFQYGTAR